MVVDWELAKLLWPIVSGAITGTIPLAVSSFLLGLVIALVVSALMRLSKTKIVAALGRFYVSVIRSTAVVQLFVIFYGLPSVGVTIEPWPGAVIAFSMNVGGYLAGGDRAAIPVGPQGAVGGRAHHRHVPSAALRRIITSVLAVSVPPLSNTFISWSRTRRWRH